jgi:hypothetical protein
VPHPQPSNAERAQWSALVDWMIRQSGGLTKLAALLSVSRQSVHAWRTGRNVPCDTARRHVEAEYQRMRRELEATIPRFPER